MIIHLLNKLTDTVSSKGNENINDLPKRVVDILELLPRKCIVQGSHLREEMEGTRPHRRPRRRWMDSVRETLMELMQSREINWDIVKDRGKWKNLLIMID
ncbi:hypothetical protein FWK35_00022583 [Aphis craccivora]|uniref:Uncharacterized protein n=1 Tax=Aphis craccivora TaxID=307492 RepID=A0A6G0YJL5_APHCR|nr:hypothetical protein FWK35_00022583 [Aphis craccivora]